MKNLFFVLALFGWSVSAFATTTADLLRQYPIRQPKNNDSIDRYETETNSLSENISMMWIELIESMRVTTTLQKMIVEKKSGSTRAGFAYRTEGEKILVETSSGKYVVERFDLHNSGFSVKAPGEYGNHLQYSDLSPMEVMIRRDSDSFGPNGKDPRFLHYAKTQRFEMGKFYGGAEVSLALELAESESGLAPMIKPFRFDSAAQALATIQQYRLDVRYNILPLAQMSEKLLALREKLLTEKEVEIGDADYALSLLSKKQLAAKGIQGGQWIRIDDSQGFQYWLRIPETKEQSLEIRGFEKSGGNRLLATGALEIKAGRVEASSDWAPENDRVVFAVLFAFGELGI